MKKWNSVKAIQKGGSRNNPSSTDQSQGQKVWFDIKSNIPGNSTDDDKYQEGTWYREAVKYLKGKLLPPH